MTTWRRKRDLNQRGQDGPKEFLFNFGNFQAVSFNTTIGTIMFETRTNPVCGDFVDIFIKGECHDTVARPLLLSSLNALYLTRLAAIPAYSPAIGFHCLDSRLSHVPLP